MAAEAGLLLSAFTFGVAYTAAPGAVNAESLRRGLTRGFKPALLVQLGSLVGDLGWAALALAGISLVLDNRPIQLALGIAGGCLMLRLAWNALQQAWHGGLPRAHGRTDRGDFATGLFFSVANPFGLAFWSGVGGGVRSLGVEDFGVFLIAFAVGAVVWCFLAALAIGWTQRRVGVRVLRWTGALAGLVLGYFGLRLVWETATSPP